MQFKFEKMSKHFYMKKPKNVYIKRLRFLNCGKIKFEKYIPLLILHVLSDALYQGEKIVFPHHVKPINNEIIFVSR